jgi:hypothetical protein
LFVLLSLGSTADFKHSSVDRGSSRVWWLQRRRSKDFAVSIQAFFAAASGASAVYKWRIEHCVITFVC